MLTDDTSNAPFEVKIRRVKKINTGEYSYELRRELVSTNKKKAPKGISIIHDLERKLKSMK